MRWAALRGAALPGAALLIVAVASVARAQQRDEQRTRVTRTDAVSAALANSPRLAFARASVAASLAEFGVARQFENPTFGASYSESAPQAHFTLDLPIDWPGQRGARIGAARAGLGAAGARAQYARALLAYETDTVYTRAQSLDARARLSQRSARDADSLAAIARVRRDAGDASDLDVELAAVFAGQSALTAATDSADAATSLLELQLLMGMPGSASVIALADTLTATVADTAIVRTTAAANAVSDPNAATAASLSAILPVAAADQDVLASTGLLALERRRRFGAPSLTVGFETGNPGGPGGALPLFGVALPLPLLNRNGPQIQLAEANLQRDVALAAQARTEQQYAIARATRSLTAARARTTRAVRLVASAERVATLSIVAYREGAATLSSALEAQRAARDVLAQFIDELTAQRIAERTLEFSRITSSSGTP